MHQLKSITIFSGTTKDDQLEGFELIDLKPGNTYGIVGPTGAGKSQLLEDIASFTQGDSPTRRKIHIDGDTPQAKHYKNLRSHWIGHLSQSMRFVLDVTVQEFLTMRSKNSSVSINTVLETANSLCGEPIGFTSQLTTLSGGQTRALMVSDVAYNSPAPVILIDELENAGINRILALELLVKSEKIVLLVTHDPLLALYGAYRIVLKNGGIVAVHERTAEETVVFHQLKRLDNTIQGLRNNLRNSERVDLKSLCLQ